MDWGSLTGLALALAGILLGQALEGGSAGALAQPAAFMIVVAGTMGAVLLQSGMPAFLHGLKMARRVFIVPLQGSGEALARDASLWSAAARREGLLSLGRFIDDAEDPFIAHGLRLIVDGITPQQLSSLLDQEISAYETRERHGARIWEAAGGYAPTIGILGAVLGLIHVMENLADPARLGGGIAVAFVSTLYGVGLANLVFLPIGNRLKMQVAHEVQRREIMAEVLAGIAGGENPIATAERLAACRTC